MHKTHEHYLTKPANGIKLIEKTYYQNIAEVIHQHHERLDGSGYPRGLKGKEILLEARIIAVADTYDAITTTRPYRDALSKEYAISELVKFTGAHYDPRVVKAFIKILEQEKSQKDINILLSNLPNLAIDTVPIGKDEKSNKLIKKDGKINIR